MKKLIILLGFLSACTTTTQKAPKVLCNDYCHDTLGVGSLYSDANLCVCKTEVGVKDVVGVCLASTGNLPGCFIEAFKMCQDKEIKRHDDQGACSQIEDQLSHKS